MADHRTKGWAERLERLARLIPGLGRYQDREGLRETDKCVRLYLVEQLARLLQVVERAQERAVEAQRLDRCTALERVTKPLGTAADRIRTASYGFSGVFDLHKIREVELADLHGYDLRLLEEIPHLRARLQVLADVATAEAGFGEALDAARAAVDGLAHALDEREHIARRL